MSDPSPAADAVASTADDGSPAEFEEGRYLYCVVLTDEGDAGESGDGSDFAMEGVEGEPVGVVTDGDLGAVVHPCESLYDSDDPTTLRRWLLAHQRVTDAAADAFGTPLPVRFDTVLLGDDEAVGAWLRESRDELRDALDALAGRREYRIEVRRDEDALADRLADGDDRLESLRARIADAGEGTGFLLEKQYDRRLSDLLRRHREEEAEALRARLSEYAEEVRPLGRNRSASLLGSPADAGDSSDPIRFAVLAPLDREGDIGSALDEVAAEDGVEVRFSGPWAPYTFAPELGAADGGGAP